MEEAVGEQLLEVGLDSKAGQAFAIDAQLVQLIRAVDLGAWAVLHGQDLPRRQLPIHLRHFDPRLVRKVLAEALCVVSLHEIVDLLPSPSRIVGHSDAASTQPAQKSVQLQVMSATRPGKQHWKPTILQMQCCLLLSIPSMIGASGLKRPKHAVSGMQSYSDSMDRRCTICHNKPVWGNGSLMSNLERRVIRSGGRRHRKAGRSDRSGMRTAELVYLVKYLLALIIDSNPVPRGAIRLWVKFLQPFRDHSDVLAVNFKEFPQARPLHLDHHLLAIHLG